MAVRSRAAQSLLAGASGIAGMTGLLAVLLPSRVPLWGSYGAATGLIFLAVGAVTGWAAWRVALDARPPWWRAEGLWRLAFVAVVGLTVGPSTLIGSVGASEVDVLVTAKSVKHGGKSGTARHITTAARARPLRATQAAYEAVREGGRHRCVLVDGALTSPALTRCTALRGVGPTFP